MDKKIKAANENKKINESEKERFARITSRVDSLAKKGWEISTDKVNKMTSSVLEDLGYELVQNASPSSK